MAKVVLQREVARAFADGQLEFDIAADNIRQIIQRLDDDYPGIGARLRERTAVAIDGEIFQDPLLQTVAVDSEVYFLPMIEAG